MNIPTIIRAIDERREMVSELTARIPEAKVVWDKTRNAMDTFIAALAAAGDGPALHLEDDVILAPGFDRIASACIEQRPQTVINFFSRRKEDLNPKHLTAGGRWTRELWGALCFYLPQGYSKQLLSYFPVWPGFDKDPTGVDIMVSDFLKSRKERLWICLPNPADHRVGPSAIDRRRAKDRRSRTFHLLSKSAPRGG